MRHDSAQTALRAAEERQRVFYEQNRGFISAPSLKYEEQRIRREVDLASDLYINLDRQLEVARIDEINDAALITVIDSAVVPRKAQWPRYGVLLLSGTLVGLLIGILVAGSAAVLADWRERNPDSWSDFRAAIRTARAEFGSMVGAGSKNRVPSLAPTETYPAVHPQSGPASRTDEPAAIAQRPVA
jgi:G-rich domain on putative tyrosine kinase